MTTQGIQDEWVSAAVSVIALSRALRSAQPADTPGIQRALDEARQEFQALSPPHEDPMKPNDLPSLPPSDWADDFRDLDEDDRATSTAFFFLAVIGLLNLGIGLGIGYLIWSK